MPQVVFGVFYHWLGGLASGSFYVPYKAVKKWSWEVYWLAGGFFSWIIAPWVMALILACGVFGAMSEIFSGKVSDSTIEYALNTPTHVDVSFIDQTAIIEKYRAGAPEFQYLKTATVKDALGKDAVAPSSEIVRAAWIAMTEPKPGDKNEREVDREKLWAQAFGAGFDRSQMTPQLTEQFKATVGTIVETSLVEKTKGGPDAMLWAFLFGCLWGVGGLTFGLTMRYLGMSLGMAIALGYCTVLGTIMPDIFKGTFISNIMTQPPYAVIILGLGVCLLGVILAGVAGMSKEREMPDEVKKEAIKEFSFVKGILVATISGVFSACMAYAQHAGTPLDHLVALHDTGSLWVGLPKLCIILIGGFLTNFVWCAILLLKNGTLYQFFKKEVKDPDAPAVDGKPAKARVNMLWNYFFSALAGTTWYFQFFFYSMGETRMGEYRFSSWTLHMASIIIFSSCWGLALHEWRGSSKFTKFLIGVAIFTLVYSTIIVGYGNLMKQSNAGEITPDPAAAV
ncbi:MAG: L-rhamnose/proton symporter RhaT, partial [Thermoguttaceae bacterium]|nr:L-rhamnose/proton symporter RhaT [Thermoguttaceae bacterium]